MSSVYEYGNYVFEQLIENLKHYKKANSHKSLHEIRVNLKKIKALFKLLKFSNKYTGKLKGYKFLRKIFKAAGVIRDIEVIQSIESNYKIDINKSLNNSRIKSKKVLIKLFIKKIPKYTKKLRALLNNSKKYFNKISNEVVKVYLDEQQEKLKLSLKHILKYSKINELELHSLRKDLKLILYTRDTVSEFNLKNNYYYNSLQNLLGKWHDKKVAIHYFKSLKHEQSHQALMKQLRLDIKVDEAKLIHIMSDFLNHQVL